jgi:hypothetical protein
VTDEIQEDRGRGGNRGFWVDGFIPPSDLSGPRSPGWGFGVVGFCPTPSERGRLTCAPICLPFNPTAQ